MSILKRSYKAAIGLAYLSSQDSAPTVEVKGEDLIAERIVRTAQRFGVPVVEDRTLARALSGLELDQQIPESLFEAVAVLLNQIEASTNRKPGVR